MKKALVLSLLVFGLSVAAFGGAFSGSWESSLCIAGFGDGNDLEFADFYSALFVDYAVCEWTFGANVVFDWDGLELLWFDASGSLGAFSFASIIEFDPGAMAFADWENIGVVSIAGVDFYGLFDMSLTNDVVGIGSAFGLLADVGDCTFGAEIQFGAGGGLYFVRLYGVMGTYGAYDGWGPCVYDPSGRFWTVAGNGTGTDCDPGFTGIDMFVDFPLGCLDVTAFVSFSCDLGFSSICFLLENIDLGLGWAAIDSMSICYQTGYKSVCVDFDLTLGDAVCVTPYVELIQDGGGGDSAYLLEGIEVNAITLTYNYNGVTFKAGEIFDNAWERESAWITTYLFCEDATYHWYFTPTGGIDYHDYCAFSVDGVYPNEFFGLTIDGDSCCGGAYDVDLYNFFVAEGASGQFGIFGWLGSYAAISVDIGTNTSLGVSLWTSYMGIEKLCINWEFSW